MLPNSSAKNMNCLHQLDESWCRTPAEVVLQFQHRCRRFGDKNVISLNWMWLLVEGLHYSLILPLNRSTKYFWFLLVNSNGSLNPSTCLDLEFRWQFRFGASSIQLSLPSVRKDRNNFLILIGWFPKWVVAYELTESEYDLCSVSLLASAKFVWNSPPY